MGQGSDDWYRHRRWDPAIEQAFEARLARAWKSTRHQYLRIQAIELDDAGDPELRPIAERLFLRAMREYPDPEDDKFTAEMLAAHLAEDGRLYDALGWYHHARALIDQSPTGESGTTGTSRLRIAELQRALGQADVDAEGFDAWLADAQEHVQDEIQLDVVFRWLYVTAVLASELRRPEAASIAREALAVAGEPSPFEKKGIGPARPTPEQLSRLTRIVEAAMPRQ